MSYQSALGPRIRKSPDFGVTIEGSKRRRVGLFIDWPPLAGNEHTWRLSDDHSKVKVGTVRVVTHSPRFERNIAIALIDAGAAERGSFRVEHRPAGGAPGLLRRRFYEALSAIVAVRSLAAGV